MGAESVEVGTADAQSLGSVHGIDRAVVELIENPLEEREGKTFAYLFFSRLRIRSKPRTCVEGFRGPSLRSGPLKPSTQVPPPPLATIVSF